LTVRQAKQKAREIKLQLSQGVDVRRERRRTEVPTVAEALDAYLSSRDDLSPKTERWYRGMVDGPLKSHARRRMDEVGREECRRIHERATVSRGPYMANSCMRVLKLLHNDVARTQDLPPNPVSRAVRMNKERARDAAILPQDMPAMWRALEAIEDPIRRCMWETLLFTGLRSGDVKSMRWSNLGEDGVLQVPSPKGGSDRAFSLPLPRYLLQRLEELRQHTAPLASDFAFPSATSREGHITEIRRSSNFDYHPHQFRHSLRSYGLLAGVDEQVIKLLLNHKDASVTGGYLTKAVVVEPMRKGIEAISEVLLSYRSK
jgi:integrase